MEWSLMNPIGLAETDIGFLVNGVFILSDSCEDTLLEILDLVTSDGSDGAIRRQIWRQDLITKELVPMLLAVEEDSPLTEHAIKLLSLLTQPLDLQTSPHPAGSPEHKRVTVVVGLLEQAYDVCWNSQFLTKVIKNEIFLRLERSVNSTLNPKDCETINYALLLLRNLFYFAERDQQSHTFETCQTTLFESGVDKVLLAVLRCPQKILFTVSVVQILSFLFKGHEKYAYKLRPSSHSPLTSPLKSACSVYTGAKNNPVQMTEPLDMLYDSVLRREFIDSIMDTMELKKPGEGASDEEEICGDREQQTSLEAEAHSQMPCKIYYLQTFLKQFMSDHYTAFIADLLKIAMTTSGKIFDDSYLIWSLSFFPRFASDQDSFLPDIVQCVDVNLISYLVSVMVDCTEKLQSLQQQKQSCEQTHQKLHLTVLSLLNLLRLMMVALDNSCLSVLIPAGLQEALAKMCELRDVFLLLLRHHQCNKHGMSYLRDVIITNHHLLLLLEKWGVDKISPSDFSMLEHVKKFATVEVMGKYGHALEDFDHNHRGLNDCILTMMHHIAGDCNQSQCLMQLSIMKTFTDIWDQKHLLSEEFNDLIEYVLEQFMRLAEENPIHSAQMLFGTKDTLDHAEEEAEELGKSTAWSEEETEILMTTILDLEESDNIGSDLKHALEQSGIHRTEDEIESYVREMGWLPSDMVIVAEESSRIRNSTEECKKMEIVEELTKIPQEDLLEYLVTKLEKTGNEQHLHWLQDNLLQSADAKLCVMHNSLDKIREPVRRICAFLKKDFPIIMVTEEQEKICHDIYFFALLNELGLKSAIAEERQVFWRIPFDWTASQLLEKAQRLGPISLDIKDIEEEDLAGLFSKSTSICSTDDFSEEKPISTAKDVKIHDAEWITCVQKLNKMQMAQSTPSSMDVN